MEAVARSFRFIAYSSRYAKEPLMSLETSGYPKGERKGKYYHEKWQKQRVPSIRPGKRIAD